MSGRSGESFISPTVQREQIAHWAKLRNAEILEIHEDLDQSGGGFDRPGLQRAIERVEAKESSGIVVAKLDRFARSLQGALETIKRIHDAGGDFVCVDLGVDPTTPMGKMQTNLLLVLAEFELDRIREQWSTAREHAVGRGVHISRHPPSGYDKGPDGRLIPNATAPYITEAFKMRAAGKPYSAIAEMLMGAGAIVTTGSSHWSSPTIRHIIANPAYLGRATSGSFSQEGAHEPLIDEETFNLANGRRAEYSRPATTLGPSLLAGLLRCAGCQYAMKPDTMLNKGTGERVRTYRCRGDHASGKCMDRAAVLGNIVETEVIRRFLELMGKRWVSEHHQDDDLTDLIREAEEAEREMTIFRDDPRIISVLGPDEFVAGLRTRAERVDSANRALIEARSQDSQLLMPPTELRRMWPTLEVEEQKELLGSVWDAIFIRSGRQDPIEDRLLFFMHGEKPDGGPTRKRKATEIRPLDWERYAGRRH
ncbi:recombinase family protein [Paraconexibacter antarcticus]|uniref:Recombinase family protein n=1 Tax=Paraconexibacter antarcticus TaxID=2949664 RepID=A0ABY5DVR2_9ACTN|nr:recombinase family protein [Paraconexibacter antarcticus]